MAHTRTLAFSLSLIRNTLNSDDSLCVFQCVACQLYNSFIIFLHIPCGISHYCITYLFYFNLIYLWHTCADACVCFFLHFSFHFFSSLPVSHLFGWFFFLCKSRMGCTKQNLKTPMYRRSHQQFNIVLLYFVIFATC